MGGGVGLLTTVIVMFALGVVLRNSVPWSIEVRARCTTEPKEPLRMIAPRWDGWGWGSGW